MKLQTRRAQAHIKDIIKGARALCSTSAVTLGLSSCLMMGSLMCWGCDAEDTSEALDMRSTAEPLEHEWTLEASFVEEGTVMSVWGAANAEGWSAESVWAVGGQPDQGRMWMRREGNWIEGQVPEGALLNWVHGANGHLWVVGNGGRALRQISPEIGGDGSWQVFDSNTDQDLWGVWVRSPDEVWAVGGDPLREGEADPVITHFDGTRWRRVEVPPLDRSGVRSLFKVYGEVETGRVFAVGMKGVILGDLGEGWRQFDVTPAGDAPPSSEDLVSLWGDDDGILAVGGRSNGILARWDGSQWSSTTLAGVPGLNGVWMDQRGIATTVGVRGAALTVAADALSGARERTGTSLVLHAVWGGSESIWAVGGSLDNSPPWEGVILHTPH